MCWLFQNGKQHLGGRAGAIPRRFHKVAAREDREGKFEKEADGTRTHLDDALVGFEDLMILCRLGSIHFGLDHVQHPVDERLDVSKLGIVYQLLRAVLRSCPSA